LNRQMTIFPPISVDVWAMGHGDKRQSTQNQLMKV
jgi:hypothetical protein